MRKRNQNHHEALPSAAPQKDQGKIVNVELTEDLIRLNLQIIRAAPIQGNVQTLPKMLEKIAELQERLLAAMTNPAP